MDYARAILRETIRKNGGRRGFSKTGDGLMRAILSDMAAEGELVRVGETEGEVIYGLPEENGLPEEGSEPSAEAP